jgi:hypothetical protein
MGTKARRRLGRLLDEAAARGAFFVPSGGADARLAEKCAREGMLVRPLRGMFAKQDAWRDLDPIARHLWKMRALQQSHPDWVFCCQSAAVAWGASVSYGELEAVCVAVEPGRSTHARQEGIRRVQCDVTRAVRRCGVRVTPAVPTMFDVARRLSFTEGLVTADSALHLGIVDRDSLLDYAADHRMAQGAARAFVTFSHADGRAESGGESMARAAMLELGFAEPDLQTRVADPIERWRTYRLDFSWQTPAGLIGGELDGRQKYQDQEMTAGDDVVGVLTKERRRESRLSAQGVRIIRFSYSEVLDRRYFARLLTAFGVLRPGVPAELRSKWVARRLLDKHAGRRWLGSLRTSCSGEVLLCGTIVRYEVIDGLRGAVA